MLKLNAEFSSRCVTVRRFRILRHALISDLVSYWFFRVSLALCNSLSVLLLWLMTYIRRIPAAKGTQIALVAMIFARS